MGKKILVLMIIFFIIFTYADPITELVLVLNNDTNYIKSIVDNNISLDIDENENSFINYLKITLLFLLIITILFVFTVKIGLKR